MTCEHLVWASSWTSFGAGYSSLGVLADLPISGIKCDRLFVRQLPQDPRRQSLLRHVVRLARDLQLEVVVEGVETEQELQSVLEVASGTFKGYFFSKAMSPEDVPLWHQAYRPADITERPLHQPCLCDSAETSHLTPAVFSVL